jgi:hypothetical protein
VKEGADRLDLGGSVGCLLDPGKLQLHTPSPFVVQRVRDAGWSTSKGTQVAGLKAVTKRGS